PCGNTSLRLYLKQQRQYGHAERGASQPAREHPVQDADAWLRRAHSGSRGHLHLVQDRVPQCKCVVWRWQSFPEASPENERERNRTLHHQLTEKSSVVEQGVVDVYYA